MAGLTILPALCATAPARADWPMARHDVHRAAVASGVGDIQQPASFWRHDVGGYIGLTQALAYDVDLDGSREVVMISGGKVAAKNPANGDTVWETKQIEASEIVGVRDLDANGTPELVVRSNDQVYVLRLLDGLVVWAEPEGEMGWIGGVRLADFDGDGGVDVLIQECGCCSVNSGNPGFVYRFAGGGATLGSPQLMWTLPAIACGSSKSGAVVHMRSPQQTEFINGLSLELQLLDGASGAMLASAAVGPKAQVSECIGVDVLPTGAEELLCILNDPLDPPDNGRRMFLLTYDAGNGLSVAWQQLIGDTDGALVVPPAPLADLDGDGSPEIVVGGQLGGQPHTFVYQAASGSLIDSLPGTMPAGTAVVTDASPRLLLATGGDQTLRAYELSGGSLNQLLSLPQRGVVAEVDWDAHQRSRLKRRTLVYDTNGDGVNELVTINLNGGNIVAHDLTNGGAVTQLYQPPAGVGILGAWRFDLDGLDLGLAQSDGNLHLMNEVWLPLSGKKDFGARFGGYYSPGTFRQLQRTPIMAEVDDGGPPGLFVHTSQGAIERLDATDAGFAQGPSVVWSRDRSLGLSVVPGLAGAAPGLLTIDTSSPNHHSIVALRTDGSELWSQPLDYYALTDLVYGNVDGDSIPDVFVNGGLRTDSIERITALSGADGSVLWEAQPIGPFNRQPAGSAVADWDGDGIDDLIFQADATRIISGATGQEILQSTPGWSYYLPIIADVDDDGQLEATLHGGFWPASTLDHDLSPIWQGQEEDRPMNYGALVRCGSAPPQLIGSGWQNPSRLKLTAVAGPQAGDYQTVVLAGGGLFADEEQADAAMAQRGKLGSPSVHDNIAGDGRFTVLVGSTDGWLYGVDPCTLTLRFSQHFDAPVGSAIFGDTDGDGLDEILVSVADGHLYGLKASNVPLVDEVLDTDPPNGILDEDVDEIETVDTLYAAWTPSPGAVRYEVAVIADAIDGGGFISPGPWFDAGSATSAELPELPLDNGRRYFVAVRAIAADGSLSPDQLSDGVRVRVVNAPIEVEDERLPWVWLTGRSCVYFCATASPLHNDRGWVWPLLLLGVLALRRGRRARSRP